MKRLLLGLLCVNFSVWAATEKIEYRRADESDIPSILSLMTEASTQVDKILILPIAFYSLFKFHKWLLLILLLVEIINALASIFYKSKEIYLESDIFGKTKMVMLSVVFAVILIIWPRLPSQLFVYILWATIPFSFLSIFTKVLELNAKGHIKNKTVAKQLNNYENI